MYIYVRKSDALSRVPSALLAMFGAPKLFGTLLITSDKKLARAEAQQVLGDVAEKGFYLQMPPVREDYMLDLYRPDENTTGSSRDEDRLLDLVRARHMDEIWQVLRYPDGIIESKSGRGYRQFDKKIT